MVSRVQGVIQPFILVRFFLVLDMGKGYRLGKQVGVLRVRIRIQVFVPITLPIPIPAKPVTS